MNTIDDKIKVMMNEASERSKKFINRMENSPFAKYIKGDQLSKKEYRDLASSYIVFLKNYLIIETKKGQSVDHMFSVSEGYKNGIDPKIVNNKHNLRVVNRKVNSEKHDKCILTMKELLELPEDNYWEDFIKGRHPFYDGYNLSNPNRETSFTIIKSKLINDFNKNRKNYLICETDENIKYAFTMTENAINNYNKIDHTKPFTLQIKEWKEKRTYYKRFLQ